MCVCVFFLHVLSLFLFHSSIPLLFFFLPFFYRLDFLIVHHRLLCFFENRDRVCVVKKKKKTLPLSFPKVDHPTLTCSSNTHTHTHTHTHPPTCIHLSLLACLRPLARLDDLSIHPSSLHTYRRLCLLDWGSTDARSTDRRKEDR